MGLSSINTRLEFEFVPDSGFLKRLSWSTERFRQMTSFYKFNEKIMKVTNRVSS